jgi:hypothetical protein
VCVLTCAMLLAGPMPAQERVAPWNMRERLIVVVPVIGAGTTADPKRPLFVPRPGEKSPFEGFTAQLSDDGKFAIVEFIAAHPSAFKDLLNDARVVKAFRKARQKKEDVERELKVFKKDLRLEGALDGGPR